MKRFVALCCIIILQYMVQKTENGLELNVETRMTGEWL
jgi:hypothetical protein